MNLSKVGMIVLRAAIVVGAVAVAPPASADKHDEKKEERKEERKELKDARKDLKDALHDGGAGSSGAKEAREKLKEARAKLRATRDARRAAHKQELKAQLGDLVGKPAVRAEIRLHERRLARLHRVEELARADGKDAEVKRVEALVAKENARHDKRVAELKAHGGEDAK